MGENVAGRKRFIRDAWVGARFGAGGAFGLWLGDAAMLCAGRGGRTISQLLTGLGAALFVAITTALVAGFVLGPILVPLVAGAGGRLHERWVTLRSSGREFTAIAAAQGLALFVLLGALSWVAYRAVTLAELTFTRADTTAGAIVLSHWVFAATLALAWPSAKLWSRGLVTRAEGAPRLRWMFGRPWRLPALLSIPVVLAAGALVVTYRRELSALPWRSAAPLLGLGAGLAFARFLPRARRRPWTARLAGVALALAGLACVGGVFAALRLHPESTTARRIAFDRALSGRLGYAAWTALLDFDRDGQISVLGGGDCAPFDPRRFTGAIDIPGNGIDEDCDGVDLPRVALSSKPRPRVGRGAIPSRPNILLLTIDALGAPRLTTLGSPISIMPHLDALAQSSVVFSHCFSEGPSTRLSFPSMFTSRWDSQLTFEPLPRLPYSFTASERQLQDFVDDAGYESVAVIPSDYFDRGRWPSITRGFQRVDSTPIPYGKHNASEVTDAVLRILAEPRARPLYLWAHYYDAHPPYGRLPGVQYHGSGDEPLYTAELQHIDTQLGRLLDALAQRPEPTYVFVTADHSTVFHPDPALRRGHYGYDLYSATLHVPLIVHGPGISPGRANGLVSTMDIAPTIVDLLGLTVSTQFEGTSLMPEILMGQVDSQRAIFHEFYLPERMFHGFEPLEIVSMHQDRWNLVLDRARGIYELYDWNADYFEQHDLYEEQGRSPSALHLKALLGTFIERFHGRSRYSSGAGFKPTDPPLQP